MLLLFNEKFNITFVLCFSLDDRTWLHVEVTPEGLASNIHLVGHSERLYDKLQSGLLTWDHDKDIVENIMTVFGKYLVTPCICEH